MRSITRRLNRLEFARAITPKGLSPAQLIMESRRRRLEASGEPFEDPPPVDRSGCRTIADQILRARLASMERQLSKALTQHD